MIEKDIGTLYFCLRDKRTPLIPKIMAAFVVVYGLSPIDFIPDFIPLLGYLDDFILLPGLIWLTVQLIPDTIINDNRVKAHLFKVKKKKIYTIGMILVWLLIILIIYLNFIRK